MAENLVNSIRKAFNVLDILVCEDPQREGFPLSRLSKRTGIRPNTLHNILKTMIHCGYVSQREDSTYCAGHKLFQAEKLQSVRDILYTRIKPILSELSERINEGIVFYSLFNGGKAPLLFINDNQIINVDYSKYDERSFFAKPTGRILAAFSSETELKEIIARWGLPGENWADIKDFGLLSEKLSALRVRGYETLKEKNQVISFAVPVLDFDGELYAAIGSYAPLFRCDTAKQEFILNSLKDTAEEIKKLL